MGDLAWWRRAAGPRLDIDVVEVASLGRKQMDRKLHGESLWGVPEAARKDVFGKAKATFEY